MFWKSEQTILCLTKFVNLWPVLILWLSPCQLGLGFQEIVQKQSLYNFTCTPKCLVCTAKLKVKLNVLVIAFGRIAYNIANWKMNDFNPDAP